MKNLLPLVLGSLVFTSCSSWLAPQPIITNTSQLQGSQEELQSGYTPTLPANRLPNPNFKQKGTLYTEISFSASGISGSLAYSISDKWGLAGAISAQGFLDESQHQKLAKYTIPAYYDILGNYVPAYSGSEWLTVFNETASNCNQTELSLVYYKEIKKHLSLNLLGGLAYLNHDFTFDRYISDENNSTNLYLYSNLVGFYEQNRYGAIYAQGNLTFQNQYAGMSLLSRLQFNKQLKSSYSYSEFLVDPQLASGTDYATLSISLRAEGGFRRLHFFVELPLTMILNETQMETGELNLAYGLNWIIRDPNAKRRKK